MIPHRLLDRLPGWAKALLAIAALYLFLVGIGAMSSSFKLMGKDTTKELLGSGASPLVSLFIGILATTLIQSSSTSTSIVVGLVAAGAIPFSSAIYMVMGANVGTTVTNTIVSLGHMRHTAEYQRAFAAATVHDFFNLIVLTVLFPLEWATGIIDKLALGATDAFQGIGGTKLSSPIKLATKPAISALKDFSKAVGDVDAQGWILLAIGITFTFIALISLVRTLKAMMLAKTENLFDRVLFASPIRSLVVGLALTVLVQSSSITTSVAVPLVGAGVLTLPQVFPYTMGANIGTTVTALLASLATLAAASGDAEVAKSMLALQLAFHHVLFNVMGVVLLWWFRAIPIAIANAFAKLAMRNRLIPIVYILVTFYLLPALVVWLGR